VHWHEKEEKVGEEESVGSWRFLLSTGTEMWSSKACLQTVYLHPGNVIQSIYHRLAATRTVE
jgi:hypothetical protein